MHKRQLYNFSQKWYFWIGGIVCIVFSGCTTAYTDHYTASRNSHHIRSGFSLHASGGVMVFPSREHKKSLLSRINRARQKIWIEVYIFTDKEILEALLHAKKRGVDVRVILEGNPYGIPRINMSVMKTLREKGIPVVYADTVLYNFTHAKFFLIDHEYFVSTGNLTLSFFGKNRELLFFDTDRSTYHFLEKLFLRDFSQESLLDPFTIPGHMVISPLGAREKLLVFLRSAQSSVYVYVQDITDEVLLYELSRLEQQGISVFLCHAFRNDTGDIDDTLGLTWRTAKKPYLHAKVVIVDETMLFIGSQNFTKNAFEGNREVGILVSLGKNTLALIHNQLEKDCQ